MPTPPPRSRSTAPPARQQPDGNEEGSSGSNSKRESVANARSSSQAPSRVGGGRLTASPTSVRQETGRDSHSGDGGKIAPVVGGAAGRDAAAAGSPHYGAGADAGDAVDDDDACFRVVYDVCACF